jgi:2-polyprenyl-6-methoxyphenol hydroxylase-like FAD-dependent oxidoreductase
MQTSFDAVIIGAGPAGATAAILLARAGWSVALVEKQRFPRRKVCGECIAASNFPLLDALGIWSAGARLDENAGAPLRQVALMQGARTIVADLPSSDNPVHPWGRALGRETLDTLLLEQAGIAGATILQPFSVQATTGTTGDHHCEIRAVDSGQQTVLHAPVLIAAHGSWEPLPSNRQARRQGRRPADLFAFKANFAGASLGVGLLPVLSFGGGYGGMVQTSSDILTLACCIREDKLEACRRAAPGVRAGDVVEALLKQECRGVAEALRGAHTDGPWLASGPIDPGIRLRRHENFFRIGNAAGEAHPIIGEGISMAIQSAWLLCSELLQADTLRSSLSDAAWQRGVSVRYNEDWRSQFSGRLRLAELFAQLAMRPEVSAPLLALLSRWPSLIGRGARWSGKVRCAPSPEMVSRLARNGRPLVRPVA